MRIGCTAVGVSGLQLLGNVTMPLPRLVMDL
jgi:hypothetical protein